MNVPIAKIGDNKMTITVAKEIYSPEAIVAACYKFTDEHYVFIQSTASDPNSIEIIAECKSGDAIDEVVVKLFCNELIDQQVRYNTNQQFGHIRDLIVDEAFKPISK